MQIAAKGSKEPKLTDAAGWTDIRLRHNLGLMYQTRQAGYEG
jgi:hypothetical protein